jgi:hypothetical protein
VRFFFFILLLFLVGCGPQLTPLQSQVVESAETLPEDAQLIVLADLVELKEPFVLRREPGAVGGQALALPRGVRKAGEASLSVTAPPGEQQLWLRARWRDSCGNSVSLSIDGKDERTVGQDGAYGIWHWVHAGVLNAKGEPQLLTLHGREDGIAIDELLLTSQPDFQPRGSMQPDAPPGDGRHFADDFSRSPAHGLDAWDTQGEWEIAFSFDPNRVPLQYSLVGKGGSAAIRGPAWGDCHVSCSFHPNGPGSYGIALGKEVLRLHVAESASTLVVQGETIDLGARVRPAFWHRLRVARWGGLIELSIDDTRVFWGPSIESGAVKPRFVVESGIAAFDDVQVVEMSSAQDDRRARTIPWEASEGWFRAPGESWSLVGKSGALELADERGIAGIYLALDPDLPGAPSVSPTPTQETQGGDRWLLTFDPPQPRISLSPEGPPLHINAASVRFADSANRSTPYRVGPFDFSSKSIANANEYYDFTPDEVKTMLEEDRSLNERSPLMQPVIASKGASKKGVWERLRGSWTLLGGAMIGRGKDAWIRYHRGFVGDLSFYTKVRLAEGSRAAIVLRADDAGKGAEYAFSTDELEPGEWHELFVDLRNNEMRVRVGQGETRVIPTPVTPTGQVWLKLESGTVSIDDLEFALERRWDGGFRYAFDRQETDWWSNGKYWLHHAGIACVYASSWITLQNPDSEPSLMWNKRSFADDLQVGMDIEEFSKWYGWRKKPNHEHMPWDHLGICLSPTDDPADGYQLVLNADNRKRTILYRKGEIVASVPQNGRFPVRFVGGHEPYQPRTCRLLLRKETGVLTAYVSDQEVLRYEDSAPLPVSRVGIGGHETHANIANIEVIQLP